MTIRCYIIYSDIDLDTLNILLDKRDESSDDEEEGNSTTVALDMTGSDSPSTEAGPRTIPQGTIAELVCLSFKPCLHCPCLLTGLDQ